jgi:hypothetical protein
MQPKKNTKNYNNNMLMAEITNIGGGIIWKRKLEE